MDPNRAKWRVVAPICLILLVFIGIQFQNFLWSTARVENHSGRPLARVELRVDDATVQLGDLPDGATRFRRLPKRGDATLQVRFSAGGGDFTRCSEYVEGSMYHVRITIDRNLMADCRAELDAPFRRIMLLEIFR